MSAERSKYGNEVRLPTFPTAPCPICGETYSKCGLPNHIRGHRMRASRDHDRKNSLSASWWEAWKEGYQIGLRDGRNQERKKRPRKP